MGRGDGADVDERGGGGVESPRGEAEMEGRDAHCCGGGGGGMEGRGEEGKFREVREVQRGGGGVVGPRVSAGTV